MLKMELKAPEEKDCDKKFKNPRELDNVFQNWNYLNSAKQWLPGEGTFITHNNYRYLIGPAINMGINGHIHYCYKYPLPSTSNKNGKNGKKPTVETLAAKIVPNKSAFSREIRTLQALQSGDNICKLYSVLQSELTLISILELAQSDAYNFFVANGHSKFGWNLSKPAIREHFSKLVVNNIISGLSEMHKLNYIHCDLKLLNILLYIYQTNNSTKKGGLYFQAKLTDFGHSIKCIEDGQFAAPRLLSNGMTNTGTVGHVAPELFKVGNKCNFKVDIWSLGIVIFSMLIPGHFLFGKYQNLKQLKSSYDRIINRMNPWSTERPKWWNEFERLSPESRDIILWLTRWNINERPSLSDIIKHPWFCIGKNGFREKYRPNLKYFDAICSSCIAQE